LLEQEYGDEVTYLNSCEYVMPSKSYHQYHATPTRMSNEDEKHTKSKKRPIFIPQNAAIVEDTDYNMSDDGDDKLTSNY